MLQNTFIGVDLGGTTVTAGRVEGAAVVEKETRAITADAAVETVLEEIISAISRVITPQTAGVGVGVPSVVDVEKGIVYSVVNIPSWQKVELKTILEKRFDLPVFVNNDANCFAVGVKYFGAGKGVRNLVSITLGTGLGAGIVVDNRLYNGANCGAGEFGCIPYLQHDIEYYCSGGWFRRQHGVEGRELCRRAEQGNAAALKIFSEFGTHVASAIATVLFAVDPELIVLGGSVSGAWPFFKESMWRRLRVFPFPRTVERLQITVNSNTDMAVLGAVALFRNSN